MSTPDKKSSSPTLVPDTTSSPPAPTPDTKSCVEDIEANSSDSSQGTISSITSGSNNRSSPTSSVGVVDSPRSSGSRKTSSRSSGGRKGSPVSGVGMVDSPRSSRSRGDSSRSSSSSDHDLDLHEFFKELFPQGTRSKNVRNVEHLQMSDERMQTKILEIFDRDSRVVDTESTVRNLIRASLCFYQNGNHAIEIKEKKISIPIPSDDERKERQDDIVERETRDARNVILSKIEMLNRSIDEIRSNESVMTKIHEIESGRRRLYDDRGKIRKGFLNPLSVLKQASDMARGFDKQLIKLRERNEEDVMTELSRYQEADSKSDSSKEELLKRFENDKVLEVQRLINNDPALWSGYESSLFLTASNNVIEYTSELDRLRLIYNNMLLQISEAQREKEEDTADYINLHRYTLELQKCEAMLAGRLDNMILLHRGHSEDYLYYFLRTSDFLKEVKDSATGCNRFYLLVSSTRDSCNRCSIVMEKIAELLTESLNPGLDDGINCKVFYSANKQTTRNSGKDYVKKYDHDALRASHDDFLVANTMSTPPVNSSTSAPLLPSHNSPSEEGDVNADSDKIDSDQSSSKIPSSPTRGAGNISASKVLENSPDRRITNDKFK